MNNIKKVPVAKLGYDFIPSRFLPLGNDEYYLRNLQNNTGIDYRALTALEIETLCANGNTSDNWNNIFVSEVFNLSLIKNCKFYGLIRIGKLEPFFLEFSDMKYMVGLYNSTIISCDLGDNVVVDNVNYLSHYILCNEVIIVNVNEIATTNHSKFGNGILKEGENESVRIWMEICNENAGRSVLPFNGMQPGDAFLWSKYRDDAELMECFKEFTKKEFDEKRGYYGKIGERTIIKNSAIIKDVWIGSDAYIKGANKIKNITINSGKEGKTQIGEGCELVNGIIGYGCRIFYGVKAVRFVMASNSQLKYGARLINSYLGNNATISCCEVLNSLIFPAHEQHHNNSFLCAALVMGQSNIPAGATIGSNHNSRAADGEIIAQRGFWPGLCVSLKHNSKFACFIMLAKGDYAYELNIPIPFSLISIDEAKDCLSLMPAYWFMYNMYALARNAWKYKDRDKRFEKIQNLEYDYLAPDTINEMFDALHLLETFTGKAFSKQHNKSALQNSYQKIGKDLLEKNDNIVDELEIIAEGFENSKRKTVLLKVRKAYSMFKQMIFFYGMCEVVKFIEQKNFTSLNDLQKVLNENYTRENWLNVGGQLFRSEEIDTIKTKIKSGEIQSWVALHNIYKKQGEEYSEQRFKHAIASLEEIEGISLKTISSKKINALLDKLMEIKNWMIEEIYNSRKKDYTNPFRKMVYDSEEEMNKVLGKMDENSFIKDQQKEAELFSSRIHALQKNFRAETVVKNLQP